MDSIDVPGATENTKRRHRHANRPSRPLRPGALHHRSPPGHLPVKPGSHEVEVVLSRRG